MLSSKRTPLSILARGLMLISSLFLFINCDKNNSISAEDDLYTDEQAAEAIASGMASESGGAVDQMSDLSSLAGVEGIQNMADGAHSLAKKNGDRVTAIDTSYDESDGKWTIAVSIERAIPQRNFTAQFYRVYSVQYLKGGQYQKYYITNGDTANTIKFDIVEGAGSVQSLRLKHRLKSLSASWVATNANQRLMAVAGSYTRSAADTFTTRNTVSTMDQALTVNFAGISIPANDSEEVPALIAGVMSGDFVADITITKGEETSQKSVDRSFSVAFSSKVVKVVINGGEYTADTTTGELDG